LADKDGCFTCVINPVAVTELKNNSVYTPRIIMTMSTSQDIHRRIIELEVEHRDLDAVIEMLSHDVRPEELQLRRLKKRKLQLKDHITLLKMQLVPDIPA
jgi:hypothetical protein